MIERRVAGLPLEHILGWAEFCGLRIGVATGVFVPRRRTEFLVRQAELLLRASDGGRRATARQSRRRFRRRRHAAPPSSTSAAVPVPWGPPSQRAWPESNCTPRTWTPTQCAAPGGNLEPAGGRVHEGDLFDPLPPGLRGRITGPGGQRALCPHGGDRDHAAGGPHARTADVPGRRSRRAGHPAAGYCRGNGLACTRRARADRDEPGPGTADHRAHAAGRTDSPAGERPGAGRHCSDRHCSLRMPRSGLSPRRPAVILSRVPSRTGCISGPSAGN